MNKQVIGFAALSLMGSYLYVSTLFAAFPGNILGSVVVALTLAAGIVAILNEIPQINAAKRVNFGLPSLKILFSVVGGALVSYSLSVHLGLGSVIASGLVALFAGILIPSIGPAVTCGAFAGMASSRLLGYPGILLAGSIAGLAFALSSDLFNGFGGKLGTIAATGTCLAAAITGKSFLESKFLDASLAAPIIATAIVSSVLAYYVNNMAGKGGVVASGMVSLLGGLVLPAAFPKTGGMLAAVCACGSYVGMSSKARIPNGLYAAVAGGLTGAAYFLGAPVLGGAGGKLGTTAFVSVLAVSLVVRKTAKTIKEGGYSASQ